MQSYDRGSAVLVEVEFKKQTPFSSATYFDPATAKVTITDPNGINKVTDADLSKSDTGKWYYICQTVTDWVKGIYGLTATATDGINSDVTKESMGFRLR